MQKESLKMQAYHAIKEKIISCEYAPNTMINEEALREQLEISRTPVRDALSRLEQEGLLTILPKRGVMVSGLSISDINMIFEVRMLYEPYALTHYGHSLSDETMVQFYQDWSEPQQAISDDTYFAMDDAFHQTIVDTLPNRFLLQTYDAIHTQNLRYRVMTGRIQESRIEDTTREHLAIVKACLKKDWDRAAEAMHHHLQQSKDATFDLLLHSQNIDI